MAHIIEFDLDGTLTIDNDWDVLDGNEYYRRRQPNEEMIALARQAVEKGWTVIINTGRKEHHRATTAAWLAHHNVPYHYLFMNKVLCTYRIDDANITPEEFTKRLSDGER